MKYDRVYKQKTNLAEQICLARDKLHYKAYTTLSLSRIVYVMLSINYVRLIPDWQQLPQAGVKCRKYSEWGHTVKVEQQVPCLIEPHRTALYQHFTLITHSKRRHQ